MYLDLIVIATIIIVVALTKKRLFPVILIIFIMDILMNLLAFAAKVIPIREISSFIVTYIPASLTEVINKYTIDPINIALQYLLVGLTVVFLYYLIKIFIKKKRI